MPHDGIVTSALTLLTSFPLTLFNYLIWHFHKLCLADKSEWKLLRFDKMEVNDIEILMIDVTFCIILNMF